MIHLKPVGEKIALIRSPKSPFAIMVFVDDKTGTAWQLTFDLGGAPSGRFSLPCMCCPRWWKKNSEEEKNLDRSERIKMFKEELREKCYQHGIIV